MSQPAPSARVLAVPLIAAGLAVAPGTVLAAGGIHAPPLVGALAFGSAILAAAFVLTWASEAAQKDVPRAFAIVVLSLIAVLPEYAVDVVIAWKAAHDESKRSLAIANMTGANRLLVGVAWPLVWWLNALRNGAPKLRTPRELGLEVFMLVLASVAVSSMAIFGAAFGLVDGFFLAAIFLFYAFLSIRSPGAEEHFVGPAAVLANLTTGARRASVVALLTAAALVILLVAEPFAEALVATGRALRISEFVLIQWVAPLASEAPEVVVAILLVLERRSMEAIAVLVASKVNQFTLLVGCLPFAYGWSSGTGAPLPLDKHQIAEVAVTGGQTLYAAATIANRTLGPKGGLSLFGMFLLQLAVSASLEHFYGDDEHLLAELETRWRWIFAAAYTAVALALVVLQWRQVRITFESALERVRLAFTFGSP